MSGRPLQELNECYDRSGDDDALSIRTWIYVEGYAARRWVAPKPLWVEVR